MIHLTQAQYDDLQARVAQRDVLLEEMDYLLDEKLQHHTDPRIRAIRVMVGRLPHRTLATVPTELPVQRSIQAQIQKIVDGAPNPVPLAFPVRCPSCGDSFQLGLGVTL